MVALGMGWEGLVVREWAGTATDTITTATHLAQVLQNVLTPRFELGRGVADALLEDDAPHGVGRVGEEERAVVGGGRGDDRVLVLLVAARGRLGGLLAVAAGVGLVGLGLLGGADAREGEGGPADRAAWPAKGAGELDLDLVLAGDRRVEAALVGAVAHVDDVGENHVLVVDVVVGRDDRLVEQLHLLLGEVGQEVARRLVQVGHGH